MGHGHGHGATPAARSKGRLFLVLGLTATYLVAEVVGSVVTGSLALLADAGHMLTDVAGLIMALVGIQIAERAATPERTYGYYRVEILAALANALLLIGVSVYVLYEAYQRFRQPSAVAGGLMLAVGAVGLFVNLAGMLLLRRASGESLNMKGAYFEVLSDLLTSAGVIVAAGIITFTGWMWVDPLISAGIGLFILPRTWMLLRDAVGVLLEGTPSDVSLAAVRQTMTSVPGVDSVHDLHVWTLTSGMNALSAHVVLSEGAQHDEVRRAVRDAIERGFPIKHTTIQAEIAGEELCESHL